MEGIETTEEFKIRSSRLGKRKNHRKEYALLEKILADPYPMQFGEEPMNEFPETIGWLYFHLEELHSKEPIYPSDLTESVVFLYKIVSLAWDIRRSDNTEKRVQPIG